MTKLALTSKFDICKIHSFLAWDKKLLTGLENRDPSAWFFLKKKRKEKKIH